MLILGILGTRNEQVTILMCHLCHLLFLSVGVCSWFLLRQSNASTEISLPSMQAFRLFFAMPTRRSQSPQKWPQLAGPKDHSRPSSDNFLFISSLFHASIDSLNSLLAPLKLVPLSDTNFFKEGNCVLSRKNNEFGWSQNDELYWGQQR